MSHFILLPLARSVTSTRLERLFFFFFLDSHFIVHWRCNPILYLRLRRFEDLSFFVQTRLRAKPSACCIMSVLITRFGVCDYHGVVSFFVAFLVTRPRGLHSSLKHGQGGPSWGINLDPNGKCNRPFAADELHKGYKRHLCIKLNLSLLVWCRCYSNAGFDSRQLHRSL